jgi:hypothetical protein
MSSSLVVRFFFAWCILFLCSSQTEAGTITLAWNPNPDPTVAGYKLHFGATSHSYPWTTDAGTSSQATIGGLVPGALYYFAISAYNSQGVDGPFSEELIVRIHLPPVILVQPSSQVTQAGADVIILVDTLGTPPITFQWFNGSTPIDGGTNSVLKISDVSDANAGNYTVVVNSSGGKVTSQIATISVIDPPPNFKGSDGGPEIVLGAGVGAVTPEMVAKPRRPVSFASAAGTYNGLFYQTDSRGLPAITLQTAGLLSKCVVDAQGNYSGAVWVAGLSNCITGAFDLAGNGNTVIGRANAGLSDLGVALHLDLTSGLEMTGIVSNLDRAEPWMSVLTAELQTSAIAKVPDFSLALPSMNGMPGGYMTGSEINGTLSLLGKLGDGATFTQSAPVSQGGDVPLFIGLYDQLGVVAGWVNIFNAPSTAVLTWLRPADESSQGFTNVFQATIATSIDSSSNSEIDGE